MSFNCFLCLLKKYFYNFISMISGDFYNNKIILVYKNKEKIIKGSYKTRKIKILFKGKDSVVIVRMPLKGRFNICISADKANVFIDENIHGSLNLDIKGLNNKLHIIKNVGTSLEDNEIKNCSIKVEGEGNVAYLHPKIHNSQINISANNSEFIVGNNVSLMSSIINISSPSEITNYNRIRIGKNTTFEGVNIQTYEDNSYINIGEDCQLSWGVDIWCSDSHAILNSKKEVINYGYNIEIGNHVWIGKDVKIGKNSKISDNSIVGWGSVVTHKFDQKNIIIAGVPAKIIKTGISWDRRRVNKFILENLRKNEL